MITKLQRIKEDIETLSKFNATPGNGLTRFSFTKEDRGARNYIKKQMKEASLIVYEDAAGTIVGRMEGRLSDGPVIMIGSHYDSVKNGGNFDGPAGVVMGLEIARVLNENNLKPKYPIEFIAMIEEEGGRFGGGLFASRAMVGKVDREQLDRYKDADGISIAEAMKEFGFNPDKINEAVRKPEEVKAFLELHIEQGPVLESKAIDIGIVDYIVGICQIEVNIKGRSDHAGTTPMNMRADALDIASKVISKISGFAKKVGEGSVATVGKLEIFPGAANIVPSDVTFTVDIRSRNSECIQKVKSYINNSLVELTKESEVEYSIIEKINVSPVKADDKIIKNLIKNCDKLGFSREIMLSGAGHDAMVMAEITDIGLVFVPSKDGRSHCPEEWTDYEDLQRGIELLYHTLCDLAEVDNYEN